MTARQRRAKLRARAKSKAKTARRAKNSYQIRYHNRIIDIPKEDIPLYRAMDAVMAVAFETDTLFDPWWEAARPKVEIIVRTLLAQQGGDLGDMAVEARITLVCARAKIVVTEARWDVAVERALEEEPECGKLMHNMLGHRQLVTGRDELRTENRLLLAAHGIDMDELERYFTQ